MITGDQMTCTPILLISLIRDWDFVRWDFVMESIIGIPRDSNTIIPQRQAKHISNMGTL